MTLQAMKLTKENLPTLASTASVKAEQYYVLALTRDHYALFETQTLGNDRIRLLRESVFRENFEFVEPETNRFVDVKYIH